MRQQSAVQRRSDSSRLHLDLLLSDANTDRRLWQLVPSSHDRCARHGVSAAEQHFLLAVAGSLPLAANVIASRRRRRYRLNSILSTLRH